MGVSIIRLGISRSIIWSPLVCFYRTAPIYCWSTQSACAAPPPIQSGIHPVQLALWVLGSDALLLKHLFGFVLLQKQIKSDTFVFDDEN